MFSGDESVRGTWAPSFCVKKEGLCCVALCRVCQGVDAEALLTASVCHPLGGHPRFPSLSPTTREAAGCAIFTLQVRRLTGHLFTQGHNHRCRLALSSGPFPSGDGCPHHTISTVAGLERTQSTVCWVSVISESPWPGASFKMKCHQQGNYHYWRI